ncbi:geranyl transferase, partial [Stenotrophomonas acidaminiphila]|nr:geranyl transferase [Stenotrophomonas acidaminiphila]
STFPALLGMDGAKARLEALAADMRDALAPFGARADALSALAGLAIRRSP